MKDRDKMANYDLEQLIKEEQKDIQWLNKILHNIEG